MSSKTKTTAAKEEAKLALVPKLRFPEFRGADTWQHLKLGTVLSEHALTSDGASEVHSVSLTHGVVSQIEHMGRSFAAADTSHYSLVRPFDVVYTRSPLAIYRLGIVKQHRGPKNAIISPLYGVFAPANRHLGYIIEAYFESPSRSIRYLDPLAQKGAKNTIQLSNERFLSGRIVLPVDEHEQQKIAECLSSVDELLAAQARKVNALKTHKKGLMQQLFPRAGETQPRLRFPEFQNAGEWERRRLGDFANVSASGDLDSATFSPERSEEHRFPIYSNAVEKEGIYGFSSVARCKANSVTITARGTLGRAFLRTTDFVGIGRLIVVSNFDGEADSVFLKECWDHLAVIPQEVTSIPQLTAVAARATTLPFPTLPEQQRIASCLSSLDALITAETQKHEALKSHKKGLMQQLFPSPEEVEA